MNILLIIIVLVLLLIGVLLFLERRRHDVHDLKDGALGTSPRPNDEDNLDEYISKVSKQVETFDNTVAWRRPAIVALVGAFLIIVMVKKAPPKAMEYIFAVLIIFVLTYFASHWFNSHMVRPSVKNITNDLSILRDRILKGEVVERERTKKKKVVFDFN